MAKVHCLVTGMEGFSHLLRGFLLIEGNHRTVGVFYRESSRIQVQYLSEILGHPI